MKLVLEILAVTFAGILPALLGSYFYIKYPDYSNRYNNLENLIIRWANSLLGIFVVLLVAYNQPDGFVSIGIITHQCGENGGAILIGVFTFSIFVILFSIVQKLINKIRKKEPPQEIDLSKPSPSRILRYQNRWERRSYLSVLPIAAISEDLICRGYLVLYLGNLTNNFIPWIVLSVTLSILIHLYQGRDKGTILFHFLFAAFFIAITLVTKNILAPIAAHVFLNLSISRGVWRQAKKQGIPVASGISKREKIAYAIFTGVNVVLLITMAIYLI